MGPNILATMGKLYVYLGIFHSLITKKLIPGPSEGEHCQDEGVTCPMTVTDEEDHECKCEAER